MRPDPPWSLRTRSTMYMKLEGPPARDSLSSSLLVETLISHK